MKQFIYLAILASACGGELTDTELPYITESTNKISNGYPIDWEGNSVHSWTHSALSGLCTATVIDTHTLVTSAHCVCYGPNANCLGVRATVYHDYYDRFDGLSRSTVHQGDAIAHPNWNPAHPNWYFDIAVIKLDKNIGESTGGNFLRSPLPDKEHSYDRKYRLIGYGYTGEGCSNEIQTQRRYLNAEFDNYYSDNTFKLIPEEITQDACSGDSGGAYLGYSEANSKKPYTIFAVHSKSTSSPNSELLGTPVFPHIEWLHRQCKHFVCSY